MVGQPLIIYGAGGHGLVVAEAAEASGWNVIGFLECQGEPGRQVGRWKVLAEDIPTNKTIVAIGDNAVRRRVSQSRTERLATVVHPAAIVSPTAIISQGAFIGPGAIVHSEARVGTGTIVNSGAIIEHHNKIGEFCHIAPGSVLCGNVTVHDGVLVGANSVIAPRATIGKNAVVGAGSTVVKCVSEGDTVVGNPARPIQPTLAASEPTAEKKALGPDNCKSVAITKAAPKVGNVTPRTLHVGQPNIGNRDALLARINDMLDRRWLTNNGVFVQEFEERIREITGSRHCVAMCNATVALEITIRASNFVGEVIVPSFTFVATAHALQWQQITPVFCDIDPATHTIDPCSIAKLITPRTSGIIGVHTWGNPCHVDQLAKISRQYQLPVIYDAAHAFGVTYNGTPISSFGHASVFSFHATKFVNAFEGGAVVTNDDQLAERIRLMRNFGFAGEDNVVDVGTNGKMCEASAAMGLTSLESIGLFLAQNRSNYSTYVNLLSRIPGVNVLSYDETNSPNYQYVVIEVDPTIANVDRDTLKLELQRDGVLARRYFWPGCHRMQPYSSLFPNTHLWLANTELVSSRILVLPTGTSVSLDDIKRVCEIIRRFAMSS